MFSPTPLWVPLSLIVMSEILALGIVMVYLGGTIWTGRGEWTIESSYKESEPFGVFKSHWISNGIQRKGENIVITLDKGRIISHIQFINGIKHRWAYPQKWEVSLTDKMGNLIPEWEGIQMSEPNFGKGIDIELVKPQLLRHIAITIVDPKPEGNNSPTHAKYWGFDDLRLTEVRIPWLPKWHWLSGLREGIIK